MREKKSITFATGNKGKLYEAQALMPHVQLMSCSVDFAEPRSNDLETIAREKLRQARNVISGPCFVQDSGFYIEALNGFPGSYVNFALETIGAEGILKLMEGREDRRCGFRQCLAYFDGQKEHIFTSENTGTLSTAFAGEDCAAQWSGLWHIYIPEGYDKTLSEFSQDELEARRKSSKGTLMQLAAFLKVEDRT